MKKKLIDSDAAVKAIRDLPRWMMDPNGEFQPVEPPTMAMIDPDDAIKAIENLSSANPDNTDCDYCHTDTDGFIRPIEKNGHAFISYGMGGYFIELKAKGWRGAAKIRFCPICGREFPDRRQLMILPEPYREEGKK